MSTRIKACYSLQLIWFEKLWAWLVVYCVFGSCSRTWRKIQVTANDPQNVFSEVIIVKRIAFFQKIKDHFFRERNDCVTPRVIWHLDLQSSSLASTYAWTPDYADTSTRFPFPLGNTGYRSRMLRYHSLASLHMFLRLTFLCSAVHQLNLGWYEVVDPTYREKSVWEDTNITPRY